MNDRVGSVGRCQKPAGPTGAGPIEQGIVMNDPVDPQLAAKADRLKAACAEVLAAIDKALDQGEAFEKSIYDLIGLDDSPAAEAFRQRLVDIGKELDGIAPGLKRVRELVKFDG